MCKEQSVVGEQTAAIDMLDVGVVGSRMEQSDVAVVEPLSEESEHRGSIEQLSSERCVDDRRRRRSGLPTRQQLFTCRMVELLSSEKPEHRCLFAAVLLKLTPPRPAVILFRFIVAFPATKFLPTTASFPSSSDEHLQGN